MTAQTILPANTLSGGYEVANSLRFSRASSTGLELDLGTPTNAKKYTISFWIKREVSGNSGDVIAGGTNGSNETFIRMNSNGQFQLKADHGSATSWAVNPNALGRDPSAWYNYILAVDTSQGTASNRVKIYLNGELQSLSTANYPDQNHASDFLNNDNVIHIGKRNYDGAVYFGGYLCEFVFLDGQTLDATSFGEFDSDSGIWKPIDVSGLTFGNNGFYLEFKQSGTSQNSSGLGADTSGNDNHFAVENLTAVNQSTDTCTNNYITMNPNNATLGSVTLSEGNLKASLNGNYQVFGTINLTSGKWYWEQKIEGSSLFVSVADGNRATVNTGTGLLNRDYAWAYRSDGVRQHENTTSSYGNSFTTNDIIGVALDMDNGFIYFSKNGTFQNSGDPTSGATGTGAAYSSLHTDAAAPDGLTPCLGQYGGDQITSWNFGSPPYAISSGNSDARGHGNFEYAVPSGYFAINTKNLAEFG